MGTYTRPISLHQKYQLQQICQYIDVNTFWAINIAPTRSKKYQIYIDEKVVAYVDRLTPNCVGDADSVTCGKEE